MTARPRCFPCLRPTDVLSSKVHEPTPILFLAPFLALALALALICNSKSIHLTMYSPCTYHTLYTPSPAHQSPTCYLPFPTAPGGANGWRAVKRAVEGQGLEPGLQQGQGLGEGNGLQGQGPGQRPGSRQGQGLGPGQGKGKGPVGKTSSPLTTPTRLVWRVTEVVEDERGVKRCVVVRQQQQQQQQQQLPQQATRTQA